jgi:membrane-associated phospholipid phosphatase
MTATAGFRGSAHPVVMVARRMVANALGAVALLLRPPRGPDAPRRPGRLAIAAALAVAACVAALFLLDPWEMSFYRQMWYGALYVFSVITDFGKSDWFLVPTGLGLVVIAAVASPALGRSAYLTLASVAIRVGFVFTAIALPSLVVTIGKRLIGRARPPLFRQTSPLDFAPFSWHVAYASLPSGHSTTAFAAAIAIGALFPRARVALWVYAGIIALSRVALAAHYPSDVIAGAIVGGGGALLVRRWFAARRLGFVIGPDGVDRALPGPSVRRIKGVAHRVLGQ